jgi:hypothetical protein
VEAIGASKRQSSYDDDAFHRSESTITTDLRLFPAPFQHPLSPATTGEATGAIVGSIGAWKELKRRS